MDLALIYLFFGGVGAGGVYLNKSFFTINVYKDNFVNLFRSEAGRGHTFHNYLKYNNFLIKKRKIFLLMRKMFD